ncbi:N-acetylmuramic acid 6-phosphate etherase [Paenibacillus odorifer]|uniref:N-acetylmuramic acid 6-phosphate etherase n=1 Tax=Paenibacillus TaxID=44249 RepID=UPI00096E0A61|nr:MULTISPECIES: N-acetylmuramic acid 6-phosphate etherase [Paenibacillus]MDH6428012.1 N-acetylmuramic acid 6-phosphate etherase [Paenibacillus sp. PastH-4]MDH6444359.1 N-acetylmuramic acid 6-phosphate etherase [Paenibacillus sp. PastF-4]MDH6528259.1 N-acetylmuramic acid 6-phosphate etherase [Paenibacillus sp. PastH-3]OMD61776.1 N-acetylmuramic acid 6-phosphate etherase [Paenibacillus odorifer]OMD67885.1 N-acetylmuramic acid 6-phosphate etherase [Paenibacillus odorifer]
MNDYLAGLTTEAVNPDTLMIDECTTEEMIQLMNQQDALVPRAITEEIPQIAKAVDILHHRLSNGGRMFYIGAGSSGRLGVLDASECPPTFGTDPSLVQGYIAGGDIALRTAVEGCEDDMDEGIALIESIGVTNKDVLIGISASGSANYVIAALAKAKELGAATIGVCNNRGSKFEPIVDVCITPVVGPEVISGSTRLKAGTAQKLVLNMLTTCTMVKLGKTYNNLMVDLKASNFKLVDRSIRIIMNTTGVDTSTAAETLEKASMNCKLAIMMIKSGLDAKEAEQVLNANGGRLKQAIASLV